MTEPAPKQAGDAKDGEFYCGLAVGLGCLIRDFDQPSMAIDIMKNNGVTFLDLKKAGVEPFDLNPIRKAWTSEGWKP